MTLCNAIGVPQDLAMGRTAIARAYAHEIGQYEFALALPLSPKYISSSDLPRQLS